MNNEQKQELHRILLGETASLGAKIHKELSGLVDGEILSIEPLIDEWIRQARESADIECVQIPFHAIVQLIVILKAYEWREPRPGFVHCAECKIEFQATPIAGRHHRRECRYGELLKFLQATITAKEGSTALPFPKTREALKENGYAFDHSKVCPSCNVTIEMWKTPKGNMMPLDFKIIDGTEHCEPHFSTCKKPELYSRRLRDKKEKKEAAESGPIEPDALA